MKCPKCGEECDRESVDVGVGVICGPLGCYCGWSEDPQYDRSEGKSEAQKREAPGRYVDQFGVSYSISRIADTCEHLGIPWKVVEETFDDGPEEA